MTRPYRDRLRNPSKKTLRARRCQRLLLYVKTLVSCRVNRVELGRKLLYVEPLPDGALPKYTLKEAL